MGIRIGTCGYRYYDPEGWDEEYDRKLTAYSDEWAFDLVELNSTFYSLPQLETTRSHRRDAVEDFEFSLKAWQAITHPWSSPTWNGQRDEIPDEDTDDVGYFQPTEAVFDAWERTREHAEALEASVCLLQTSAGFDATDDHESNLRTFATEIDRGDLTLAWEPRGDWKDQPDRVREICGDLDLVHAVDLLRDDPVSSHDVAYTRLHGLNEDPYDYAYDYSTEELERLAGKLTDLAADHDPVYCLFNNDAMFDNARELAEILSVTHD